MSSESEERPNAGRPFSIGARIESFGHAFSGIASLLRSEHNARIHGLATLLVLVFGWGSGIGRGEWMAIIFAIAFVWTAEAFNTAIEALCDVVSPDQDSRIKKVKDIAAGAVLLSAMGALGIGLMVFVPRIFLALVDG